MNYFDELQLLHEKAGCGGQILHETAGSGTEGVLDGPVRALGRVEGSGRGAGPPCDKTASRAPEGLCGSAILRFLTRNDSSVKVAPLMFARLMSVCYYNKEIFSRCMLDLSPKVVYIEKRKIGKK